MPLVSHYHEIWILTRYLCRIIDWGFACPLPLQFAIGFPRFLAIEPRELEPPTAPSDLFAFSSEFLQLSPVRKSDREILIESILPQARTVPQSALTVLSVADADWRNLMYEAAGSKDLHKWMARTNWLLTRDTDVPTILDLEREVEDLLRVLLERLVNYLQRNCFRLLDWRIDFRASKNHSSTAQLNAFIFISLSSIFVSALIMVFFYIAIHTTWPNVHINSSVESSNHNLFLHHPVSQPRKMLSLMYHYFTSTAATCRLSIHNESTVVDWNLLNIATPRFPVFIWALLPHSSSSPSNLSMTLRL